MKKYIKGILLTLIIGSSAMATAANAAWCKAASSHAWGFGEALHVYDACTIALNECALRTTHDDMCYVVSYGY